MSGWVLDIGDRSCSLVWCGVVVAQVLMYIYVLLATSSGRAVGHA